ncbi:MAG: hypothetical protein QOH76_3959 [Thermoleophilaceae bacterium]|nr:hypothetical protein [Thermoleophilaceae bacterium]
MFRLDPDQDLTRGDWAMLEQLDCEDGPAGPWPEGTPTLVKLIVWAWWGLFLSQGRELDGIDPRHDGHATR